MTSGQLAALYAGDAHAAESNLFLNAPQARSFVQSKAAAMGIDDPEEHFARLQVAAKLAATPSGFQMEANRLAGNFAPNTLPGQLKAKNLLLDQLAAANPTTSPAAAMARTYPIVDGASPALSPLAAAEAATNKQSALQYAQTQRLGGNTIVGGKDMRELVSENYADPREIYRNNNFRAVLQSNPEQASQVFEALTGRNFEQYSTQIDASEKDQRNFRRETLQKAYATGMARPGVDGTEWREQIPDPNDPNRLIYGTNFVKGNAFQKALEKDLEHVDPEMAQWMRDEARIKAEDAKVASLQNGAPRRDPRSLMGEDHSLEDGWLGTLKNASALHPMLAPLTSVGRDTLGGIGRDIQRLVTGTPLQTNVNGPEVTAKDMFGYGLEREAPVFGAPAGGQKRDVVAMLQKSPRFQDMLQKNPTRAREIMLAFMNQNQP